MNIYGFRLAKTEISSYYRFSANTLRNFDGAMDVVSHPAEEYVIIHFKNGVALRLDREVMNVSSESFIKEMDLQLGVG